MLSSRKPETRGEDTIRTIYYYVNGILLIVQGTVEKLRTMERWATKRIHLYFWAIDMAVAEFVHYVQNIRPICTQD